MSLLLGPEGRVLPGSPRIPLEIPLEPWKPAWTCGVGKIIVIMFVLILQPVKSSWDQTTLFANHVSSTACVRSRRVLFTGANLQAHTAADTDVDALDVASASGPGLGLGW